MSLRAQDVPCCLPLPSDRPRVLGTCWCEHTPGQPDGPLVARGLGAQEGPWWSQPPLWGWHLAGPPPLASLAPIHLQPGHLLSSFFFLPFFLKKKRNEIHNLFLLVFTHNIYRIYLSVLNDLKTKQLFPGALLGCCYSLWFPSPEGSLGHSACVLAALYCADGEAS